MNFFLPTTLSAFCFFCVTLTATAQSQNPKQIAEKIFFLTNAYRASHNRPALTPSMVLASEALAHSRQMADRRVDIGHEGFEERVRRISELISYTSVGENVGYLKGAAGDTANRAIQLWVRSPDHNANLLGEFDLVGIGVATNNKGETFVTQIFLLSKDATTPPPNKSRRKTEISKSSKNGVTVQQL